MKNYIEKNNTLTGLKVDLLKWVVTNDPRVQDVETTSEAKSILKSVSKYWSERI